MVGDTNDTPTASTLVLFEEGKRLGPGHSVHQLIAENGLGRFSHWGDALRFSSSDNSDPRTNRRTYMIVGRPAISRLVGLGFLLFGILVGLRQRRGLAGGLPEIRLALGALESAGGGLRPLSNASWLVLRMTVPIAAATAVLWAVAFVIADGDADRGFFANGVSIDMLIVKVQRDRAAQLPAPDIAFVGDSSCLMDIDIRRLRGALPRRSIESLCTLAFVGPAGYALLVDRMLDRGAAPGKVVLVFNPVQFQREESWDVWLKIIADGPVRPTADLAGWALDYFRRKWFDEAFYTPLPADYGKYYGGATQLEAVIRDNHGSAIDPNAGLDIGSLAEFQRRAADWQVTVPDKPAFFTLNDLFRQALIPLAHTVARFGVQRTYLIVTPVRDVNYSAQTAADLAASTQQIAAALGIPARNVIATQPVMPAPYFSTATHLNRWGRELYTDAVAAQASKNF